MKNEVPVGAAVAVVVVLVAVVAYLLIGKAGTGKVQSAGPVSAASVQQAQQILARTRGDRSKMTPDEAKTYDAAVSKGLVIDPSRVQSRPNQVVGPGGTPPPGMPPSNLMGGARPQTGSY